MIKSESNWIPAFAGQSDVSSRRFFQPQHTRHRSTPPFGSSVRWGLIRVERFLDVSEQLTLSPVPEPGVWLNMLLGGILLSIVVRNCRPR